MIILNVITLFEYKIWDIEIIGPRHHRLFNLFRELPSIFIDVQVLECWQDHHIKTDLKHKRMLWL